MIKRILLQCATGLALLSAGSASAWAVDLTGAGASFPYPIYAKWAAKYHEVSGNRINYQSIGSGGGQQQIIAKTVDFGASDDPMKPEALQENGLLQFPAVIGGTVPVINVPGIDAGQLKLTGPVLADIFLGKVKKWDDPAIAQLNPDLQLPAKGIVVVHRSDGSGTTFGWTNYLSQVSPAWKDTVGQGKAVKWPTGQGGKGNEGVAAYVRQLAHSIGYVEYAYAHQNGLAWAQLQNREGQFVQPSQQAFAAAAAHADWAAAPGMGLVLNNEPGAESWPVTAATFILVHQRQDDAQRAREVLKFFDWAWREGADMARELDYVPLPDAVTEQIRAVWTTQIKAKDGAAVWP
ncbi:phosphate ABC transporter substrate-binding protein PstS [Castellaniella hirudinis]|uniref:phosphate ABC transporter substrate-binding protein PstS n=1 Tax=Castellaniella hirudinis TaxID=1144617 RepID=UPI0039C4069E